MIRQICSIKPEDVARVRSSELLAKLQLEDLDLILRERRLCWFGHVELSSGAIRTAYDMQIDGKQGAGRPKQTWKKLTEKNCREWKLTTVDPQERSTWRSGVRSAMRAASQERGPLMWMMPLHLHVNQKSDYDYDDDAYVQVHFRLNFIWKQTLWTLIRLLLKEQSDLDEYCLQYRLPKNISRWESRWPLNFGVRESILQRNTGKWPFNVYFL